MATNAPAGAAALAAWAMHLESERHASPHTLRAYLADVRELLAIAGGDPRAVRAETIRHWLRTLDGRLARTSLARKLAAVRAFFRFLVRMGTSQPIRPRAWGHRRRAGGFPRISRSTRSTACSPPRPPRAWPGSATGRSSRCSTPLGCA